MTRHAKSSWDDVALDDHDRPLNERGRRDADLMGRYLEKHGHVPENVICSTAERAKWTCALMIEPMRKRPIASFEAGLFHASADQIKDHIQNAPAGDLLVIGHNPGFAHFAEMLLSDAPKHAKFAQFPTSATLISEVDIDRWSDFEFGSATLIDFLVPADIIES